MKLIRRCSKCNEPFEIWTKDIKLALQAFVCPRCFKH